MLAVLSLTCYQPNSTFTYNPITHEGTLIASYLAPDDSRAFQLCEQLSGRLARAQVELANSETASSLNYNFKHLADIRVEIKFDTVEQQAAGALTRQSNFLIQILDMDAEIKQTLSYFSVLSFNSNDCLTAATCEILGETLIISSKTTGCDYSNTLFADAATLDDPVLNQSVYAELSAFNKTLRLTSGLFMKNQADPTNPVVTFDCNKHLEESNVLLCREILQDIRFTPLLDFSISFYYQMKSPRTSLMQVYAKINNIFEASVQNCFLNATYQLNNQIIIFYLTPSGACDFGSGRVQTIVGLTDNMKFSEGTVWTSSIETSGFTSESTRYSIECKQLNYTDCQKNIEILQEIEVVYLFFRVIIHNEDGSANFLMLEPTKYQECFTSTDLQLLFTSGAAEGKIIIKSQVIGFPNCPLNVLTRQSITLFMYKRTIPDGLITDIENAPFFEIQVIEPFSTANTSVEFIIQNVSTIQQISALINRGEIYCIARYQSISLPIFETIDQSDLYSLLPLYLITGLGGILGGVFVAGIQILVDIRGFKQPKQ